MPSKRRIAGVIPAALTPFRDDGAIDDADLRRHLELLVGTRGVTGVTVNGHAGEVASLTLDEQRRVLRAARDAAPVGVLVVAGVYGHSTREAVELAALAEAEGADALLIFPPEVWEFGLADRPSLAYAYYEEIAASSALPLIAFVYPTSSQLHLSTDVLLELCARTPRIAAVKEWSNDIVVYARNRRRLREAHPEVSLLSSYSRALVASLVVGADGVLSGHGSLVADVQVEAFEAVARGDLAAARRTDEVLQRLTDTFYAAPIADCHTRMKLASAMLGRISHANVRGPLQPIGDAERSRIAEAVALIEAWTAAPVS
jgi:4-hydroxy-tetrahydrodipicolinate synthase